MTIIIIIIMICWAALELGQSARAFSFPLALSLPLSLSDLGQHNGDRRPGGLLDTIEFIMAFQLDKHQLNIILSMPQYTHTHTCIHRERGRQNLPKCKQDSNTLQGLARLQWTIIIGLNRNYLPQWATMRHICRYSQRDRHSKERKE